MYMIERVKSLAQEIVLKNTGGVIIAGTELLLVQKRSNDSHLVDQCMST